MYILKNAFTSIFRNKGRNIMIGIIVVVIATAVTITLAITNSANTLVEAYYEANPLIASLSMNREAVMKEFSGDEDDMEANIEKFNDIPSITKEEVLSYGDSKYLEGFYYTNTTSLDGKNLTKASESVEKEVTDKQTTTEKKTGTTGGKNNGGRPNMPNFGGGMWSETNTTTIITKSIEKFQNAKLQTGDFTLVGYSSYNAMQEFLSGTYKITSGKLFEDFSQYNCVINKELATLNKLEVGNTITLKNSNNKKTYEFTISGIYEENSSNTKMENMYSNSANTIIVSSDIVEEILKEDEELLSNIEPSFVLLSKKEIEDFTNEVSEKGLSEYYQVTTNLEEIEQETKSITNVLVFARTFMIIILIIGAIVLLIINMINVRERKYEIGVLRTIGVKKILVISQFVFELLVISFISLLIGSGIGAIFSVDTANYLLASEIESTKENNANIRDNFGGINFQRPNNFEKENEKNGENDNLSSDEETQNTKPNEMNFFGERSVEGITEINAVVNFTVIIKLLALGLLLTFLSSLSAVFSISSFSPLTILKERS